MKMGTSTVATSASRHSKPNITTTVTATLMTFVAMLVRVPVIAPCTPATSLFTRDMICPVGVTV